MSDATTPIDEKHMRRAMMLAARGRGRVEPNPMVGCVIVRRGQIVGEGYHRRFGGPHAEVHALRAAGDAARGATVCVTLEPCCHFGKTPPCTDALLAAGVRRVVAAMCDPFPKVSGHGLAILRRHGVEVSTGQLEAEAIELNGPYLKRQHTGMPWVILKWAQSIDGKIATRTGDSKWISGEAARKQVHRLRGRVDAILVGTGTVLADDPELTCRYGAPCRIATRIVLDPQLRTPATSKLVRTARQTPTILVTTADAAKPAIIRRLESAGVEMMPVPTRSDKLDLRRLLKQLGRRGMTNILVEGGGVTLGAFLDAKLADEAVVCVSRRLIGGANAVGAVLGEGAARVKDALIPARSRLTRCGDDDIYHLWFTAPAVFVH